MTLNVWIFLYLIFHTQAHRKLNSAQLDHVETKIFKGELQNSLKLDELDNIPENLKAETEVAENENKMDRQCKDFLTEYSGIVKKDIVALEANITEMVTNLVNIVTNISSEILSVDKQFKESNRKRDDCENKESALERIDQLTEKVDAVLDQVNLDSRKGKSCLDLLQNGKNTSGVYDIYPEGRDTPIRVYCDQNTDGGGWIVFQRRQDGTVDFYRDWLDYKLGFGNLEGEFWLGNDKIHDITKSGNHELRIDMEDFDEEKRYAQYAKFFVGSEPEKYVLYADGYTGNAGDSLSKHNKCAFSTKDRDNDAYEYGQCATMYKGAWWYLRCHHANLNGQYLNGKHDSFADGINWYAWMGLHYSLKFVEMKVK